jgi:hypothetical protein
MIRQVAAASGALMALVVCAPAASAADDVTVLIQSGTVKCSLSADDVPRGGGPIAACERTDGQPWGPTMPSQEKYATGLPIAVMRGGGQFYWDGGNLRDVPPVTGSGPTLGAGQTYSANGWTVDVEGPRTRITNDVSKHGLIVYAEVVRTF